VIVASLQDGVPATVPRAEYPRPQFVREDWLCLNGQWAFETDQADTGLERGLLERELSGAILVPFAPESAASGIGATDFLEAVWYRREIIVPSAWAGRRVLLHFQAVDHDATVWVGGVEVGRHRGGFTGFSCDITDVAAPGVPAVVVVRARDSRHGSQARGKQSTRFGTYEAYYPRTTGIWQSVWMEPVPQTHLLRPKVTPDPGLSRFLIEVPVSRAVQSTASAGPSPSHGTGHTCRVLLADAEGPIAEARATVDAGGVARLDLDVPADRLRLWGPGAPHLYDLAFELWHGDEILDRARGYAGMRSVAVEDHRVLINGAPVFQRLVLDQGWYAGGLMTAPDDAALVADIELALAAGFNGARLHQKVFEERFLYHADRLGYLVWGEFGDWGARVGPHGDRQVPTASFITQWLEVLERDYSHPSVVGWCPLNETFQAVGDRITTLDDVTRGLFLATKAVDRTRPVIDASGYSHRVAETDVYDSHLYEQDPGLFAKAMAGLADGEPYVNTAPDGTQWSIPYAGQPYFCSEFGGIQWSAGADGRGDSWGYGDAPRSEEEWFTRFTGLVDTLLNNPRMFGYCYTQLTDVFQEENGIYRFDRNAKFDIARIRAIQSRPAAYETDGA
jgi:beta-galactosidase/beta-glucuronidase